MQENSVTITVQLPRELADFAKSCAEANYYQSLDHVACNAFRLLREREERRAEFIAYLNKSASEAERGESIPAEEVFQQIDEIIKSGGYPEVYKDVEVNDWLARDAERYGDIYQRSVGEQIEHWCRIGKIAEANPNTPYGVIYDEYELGLEPCDPPLASIKSGPQEAATYEKQCHEAEKIMENDRDVLSRLSDSSKPTGDSGMMTKVREHLNNSSMATIPLRIPADVLEDLNQIVLSDKFSFSQPVIRHKIGRQGLRSASYEGYIVQDLVEVLGKHGAGLEIITTDIKKEDNARHIEVSLRTVVHLESGGNNYIKQLARYVEAVEMRLDIRFSPLVA